MDFRSELRGTVFFWSGGKASRNLHKHGISFEEAVTVFDDPLLVLQDASRNEEDRDAVIGFDAYTRLLFVVFIEFEDEGIRIVSARRATRKEEAIYAG